MMGALDYLIFLGSGVRTIEIGWAPKMIYVTKESQDVGD